METDMGGSLASHHLREFCRLGRKACLRAAWGLRRRLQNTVTIRTRQGVFTMSTKDSGIALPLYETGQYEYDSSLSAVRFLKKKGFLPATDVAMLDVGANIGVISIGLIGAGEIHCAVAIEPEPVNFGFLETNVRQNGLSDRILCLQMAVGETRSTVTLELCPENPGDHRIRATAPLTAATRDNESARQTIEVPLAALDEILQMPEVRRSASASPGLLWIDVQGYEGYAFKGARSLLSAGLPTVSEIWPYGILRAGMTLAEYCQIVASIWSDYWVERRSGFVSYPTALLDRYFDELGSEGDYGNVIFTGDASSAKPS